MTALASQAGKRSSQHCSRRTSASPAGARPRPGHSPCAPGNSMLDRKAAGKRRNLQVETDVFQIRKSTFPENGKTFPAETRNRKNASRKNPQTAGNRKSLKFMGNPPNVKTLPAKTRKQKNASRKNPESGKRFPQKLGIGKTLPAVFRSRNPETEKRRTQKSAGLAGSPGSARGGWSGQKPVWVRVFRLCSRLYVERPGVPGCN